MSNLTEQIQEILLSDNTDLDSHIQALLTLIENERREAEIESWKDVIAWANLGAMDKEKIKEMAEKRLVNLMVESLSSKEPIDMYKIEAELSNQEEQSK